MSRKTQERVIKVCLDSDVGELEATFTYDEGLAHLECIMLGSVNVTDAVTNNDTREKLLDLAFDEVYG